MLLSRVLEGVTVSKLVYAPPGQVATVSSVEVKGIQYDSRRVQRGHLFVAFRGGSVDGHRFITDAVERGAIAVVLEDESVLPDAYFLHGGVAKIVVPMGREALAGISCNYFGHPSTRLRLIGVTGTNGKTTTTHLIKSVFEATGAKVGLVGTLVYDDGVEVRDAVHTTPESPDLNSMLATMVRNGCSAAVMEVSSHALAMQRVRGLSFAAAAFTNLTRDHLDFHGSMEEYFNAKKMLFDGLTSEATAVSNADDPRGREILSDTAARRLTYGTGAGADYVARNVALSVDGTGITIAHAGTEDHVSSSLIGGFNAANILAAYATCSALGIDGKAISAGITAVQGVRGRFERVASPRGWIAVIDYAHTPDAIENCLRTVRGLLRSGGKVITIFGCGGDRDRGKRPVMGKIVSEMSDITIITSDNPRTEDPAFIMQEISDGVVRGAAVFREPDRRRAIRLGLGMAQRGDVVLVAGKGHETYQVTGHRKEHFDDREEVGQFILSAS